MDDDKFEILWKDGLKSDYSISKLSRIFTEENSPKLSPKLWTALEFPKDNSVPFTDYIHSSDGLRRVLEQIWIYGFSIVSGAPRSSEKGTRIVAERLGPIFRGTFGDLWEFGDDQVKDKFSDSAYSNIALGVHTDGTYMSQAFG